MSEFFDTECFGLTEMPEVVKSLLSSRVKKIARVHSKKDLDSLRERGVISQAKLFNRLSGPILIYMDNEDVIGFGKDDVKSSIVCWYDQREGSLCEEVYYPRELFKEFEFTEDPSPEGDLFNYLIDAVVLGVRVVVFEKKHNRVVFNDSNQRGIILVTDKGQILISYSLFETPDSLPVVDIAEIPEEILEKSSVIAL